MISRARARRRRVAPARPAWRWLAPWPGPMPAGSRPATCCCALDLQLLNDAEVIRSADQPVAGPAGRASIRGGATPRNISPPMPPCRPRCERVRAARRIAWRARPGSRWPAVGMRAKRACWRDFDSLARETGRGHGPVRLFQRPAFASRVSATVVADPDDGQRAARAMARISRSSGATGCCQREHAGSLVGARALAAVSSCPTTRVRCPRSWSNARKRDPSKADG